MLIGLKPSGHAVLTESRASPRRARRDIDDIDDDDGDYDGDNDHHNDHHNHDYDYGLILISTM